MSATNRNHTKKLSIISWKALQRIQNVMRGNDATEDEIDYALENVYVYGVSTEDQ